MEDIPAYGRQDRVKCKNLQGPFQEVQIAVHSFDEVNRPAFWAFLEQAVEGFKKHTHRVEKNPEDLMPWKVLGQKWHLARKGFAPGKKVVWPVELLEELLELVSDTAPGGQFLWNNKVLVHYIPKDRSETWATVVTKRASNVELVLNGPKGAVQLGRLAELAAEQQVDNSADDRDRVRLRFRSLDDLARGDLKQFMSEHLDTVLGASVK
jgi:excinuclease ABC subunit A